MNGDRHPTRRTFGDLNEGTPAARRKGTRHG